MEKYTAHFKIGGDLGIANNTISPAVSQRLKEEVMDRLESGETHFYSNDGSANEPIKATTGNSATTDVEVLLPSHPDNIKGSDGQLKKAVRIILASYNTDLTKIVIEGNSRKLRFEYTGTVHYTIEQKKAVNHYEVYTFVVKGDFGIPTLHKTYKNELVRMCLEALSHPDTVLYERSRHTTDYDPNLPETLSVNPFDVLVIQLSILAGEVEYDGAAEVPTETFKAQHFDINVFNAEGIFMPEKVVYDDGDGVRKAVISLYYESGI